MADDDAAVRSLALVREPAPGLRGLLSPHGYDLRGHPPGVHAGLPAPTLTLVLAVGDPLDLADADGRRRHRAVLAGLHRDPVRIHHPGRQCGIHVVLHPAAARRLLARPAGALAATAREADDPDALGPAGRELAERVDAAGGWEERFAAVDDVLGRLLAATDRPGAPAPEVARAWSLLTRRAVRVADVARSVGWSERHLERRFRAEYGLGPKTLARMARFDRARRRLAARAAAGRPLDLAGLAAEHGFADQAHLSGEFRAFAGAPPTRWLAAEVGNVQDAPAPGAPPSVS